MRRSSFTLVEIMAVVALIGLIAGATAWSLVDDVKRRSMANVVGQIAHADHVTRLAAQRFGAPCVLRFDLTAQTVQRVMETSQRVDAASHALNLPVGFRVDRIIVAPSQHDRRSDTVDVKYSTGGRSASYAVRVASSDDATWMVFSGLTGQMIQINDEDELENLFATLAIGRADAD